MDGNKTLLFKIGSLRFYQEGVSYGMILCLRALNILCAFAVLVLTTKPSDLIEDLVKRGLTPKLGYVLSAVLQIIPQLIATIGKISDSQRSRGMETEGSLNIRIKAFLPLLVPVVLCSLINVKEQSLALEVRGFNSRTKKSFLNEGPQLFHETIIQLGLLALIALTLLERITGWLS